MNTVSALPHPYSQPNLNGEFSVDSIGSNNSHEGLFMCGESTVDPLPAPCEVHRFQCLPVRYQAFAWWLPPCDTFAYTEVAESSIRQSLRTAPSHASRGPLQGTGQHRDWERGSGIRRLRLNLGSAFSCYETWGVTDHL